VNERACWKDIIAFGGAIMAFVIGAGFASGQEVMQFFTHLGLWGSLAAGAVAMLLFAWFSVVLLEDGRRLQLEDPNRIFAYYCGERIGFFFEWFVPFLMFLVVSIMVAGAGATVSEHYGVDADIGRFGMAIATLVTVLLGLKRLVSIIGGIGPVIIVFTMVLGVIAVAHNPGGVADADRVLATIEVAGASESWLLSGVLYGSFSLVGLMPFIAGMGKQARSRTDTLLGGIFGGVTFVAGAMILSTGLLANIADVHDKQIPSLAVAARIVPLLASVFAAMLLAGIYTTAVPMLWTACNRICTDENSGRYRLAATVCVVLALFGGQLQFAALVGFLYPLSGYLGMVLVAGMVYTRYFRANDQ
jgi:uncharacterized membrane protein YkvI